MNQIPDILLNTYLERLSNRYDVYAQQWYNKNEYGYKPVYKPITIDVIKSHLAGEITLGFYSLDQNNNSKWMCFDSDTQDGKLDKLSNLFQSHGWLVNREGKRLGRDGHLWFFFDKPASVVSLRKLGRLFMRTAGITEDHFELFPKQDKLNKLGSLVRAPLGIHRKPGADEVRGWFDNAPQDIRAQLDWFCSQPLNPTNTLSKLVAEIEARELIIKKPINKLHTFRAAKSKINWVTYAKGNGFKSDPPFWRGPCPACKLIGHDSDDNHLWISNTGVIGCWYGCTFEEISLAVQF